VTGAPAPAVVAVVFFSAALRTPATDEQRELCHAPAGRSCWATALRSWLSC